MLRVTRYLTFCTSLSLVVACSPSDPGNSTATEAATETAGDSSGGGSGGDSNPTGEDPTSTGGETTGDTGGEPAYEPAPGGMRRLLAHQYVNSIRYLLGDAAAAAAMPSVDYPLHGFDAIGAAEIAFQASAIEQIEASAMAVAEAAVASPERLGKHVPCVLEAAPAADCYEQVATKFGRLAWRRPLRAEEVAMLVQIADDARAWGESFETGLKYELAAILQVPDFLYIIEIGEPSPDDPSVRVLTPLELATRMSFFLVGRTPDALLLDKAEAGELASDAQIRAAAQAMVGNPESRATLATFYKELLFLRDLPTLNKNADLFPQFSPDLAASMMEETLRLIDNVVWEENTDILTILDADYTFIDAGLAALYGLPPPQGQGFVRVDLPVEQNRAGLLGQASFLARFAHPAETSPTRRGLFVRTKLLCESVPPPPPGVDTTLPEDDPNNPQTMKEKLTKHMEDPSCASCHGLIDPIGLALENYDALGQFRTHEFGLPIDPSANVADIGMFDSARDLAALLVEDPRVAQCVIKN
ncbi:MAG TPA: DUF1592 domain-containing protein, partial [Nannocystis sp.]